jgi:hypothetical protein
LVEVGVGVGQVVVVMDQQLVWCRTVEGWEIDKDDVGMWMALGARGVGKGTQVRKD